MNAFALFTVKACRRNGVEAIEYGDEIWINQEHLQEKPDLSNISDRTQYYSDEFKKLDAKYESVEIINLVECLFKIF